MLGPVWLFTCLFTCVLQELQRYYENYQLMKQQQREEAEAEQEVVTSKHFYYFIVFPSRLP